MRLRSSFHLAVGALLWGSGLGLAQDGDALKLWYRQPAGAWTQALPVGNGRLAAMVFGIVRNEHIQLNEDTVWSDEKPGPFRSYVRPGRASTALVSWRRMRATSR